MAELTAQARFACPSCGGAAEWSATKQALVCPFCGTVSPMQPGATAAGPVDEHDLVAALRAIPESERGWQTATRSVKCQSCQAISVFKPERVAQTCDFCGSPALVPYDEIKAPIRPESVLPFKIDQGNIRDKVHAWYRGRWFAPNRFKTRAFTDTIHGLYLPYWTFDARADARWAAEAGKYYYVRQGGKNVRQVQWTPASGELSHLFDDQLVCASVGVDASRLRSVEPFPTDSLVPFDPGYLSGWTVERYQIDLVAAAKRSRQQMEATLRELCGAQVPGDTYRNLNVDATFTDQTFKHILAPIWILMYVYGAKSYQVVVNGVTGHISGSRPWSWIKVSLVVVLLALVALALIYLNNAQ